MLSVEQIKITKLDFLKYPFFTRSQFQRSSSSSTRAAYQTTSESIKFSRNTQRVKSVRIRSFLVRYFPTFRLNTEIYYIFLRIQSECGKMTGFLYSCFSKKSGGGQYHYFFEVKHKTKIGQNL